MTENLIAHIVLNIGTHQMSEISNVKITEAFDRNEPDHQNAQSQNALKRLISGQYDYIRRDITHDQRDHKRDRGPKNCKK